MGSEELDPLPGNGPVLRCLAGLRKGYLHRNPGLPAWAGRAIDTIVQINKVGGEDWSQVTP